MRPSSHRPVPQPQALSPGFLHPSTQAVSTPPAQHCTLQLGSLNFDPGSESSHPPPIPTPRSCLVTPAHPPGLSFSPGPRTPLQPPSACLPARGLRLRAAAPQAQALHPLTPGRACPPAQDLAPPPLCSAPPRPSSIASRLACPQVQGPASAATWAQHFLPSQICLSPSLVPRTPNPGPAPRLSLQPCRAWRHHPGSAPPPSLAQRPFSSGRPALGSLPSPSPHAAPSEPGLGTPGAPTTRSAPLSEAGYCPAPSPSSRLPPHPSPGRSALLLTPAPSGSAPHTLLLAVLPRSDNLKPQLIALCPQLPALYSPPQPRPAPLQLPAPCLILPRGFGWGLGVTPRGSPGAGQLWEGPLLEEHSPEETGNVGWLSLEGASSKPVLKGGLCPAWLRGGSLGSPRGNCRSEVQPPNGCLTPNDQSIRAPHCVGASQPPPGFLRVYCWGL
nr:vegetative cell wall protein gp1-like [Meriones unguiculatus]